MYDLEERARYQPWRVHPSGTIPTKTSPIADLAPQDPNSFKSYLPNIDSSHIVVRKARFTKYQAQYIAAEATNRNANTISHEMLVADILSVVVNNTAHLLIGAIYSMSSASLYSEWAAAWINR
jgi:hypothetical protein